MVVAVVMVVVAVAAVVEVTKPVVVAVSLAEAAGTVAAVALLQILQPLPIKALGSKYMCKTSKYLYPKGLLNKYFGNEIRATGPYIRRCQFYQLPATRTSRSPRQMGPTCAMLLYAEVIKQ